MNKNLLTVLFQGNYLNNLVSMKAVAENAKLTDAVLRVARGGVVSPVSILNETDFFKRFTVQMTSTQLDALLTELENAVEIPDTIRKAVSVIGKNTSPQNGEIWVLKHDLFIDAWGHLDAPCDHGLCWIGNLVNDTSANVAKKDRIAVVHLPLTTYYFDLACHFL